MKFVEFNEIPIVCSKCGTKLLVVAHDYFKCSNCGEHCFNDKCVIILKWVKG